MPEFSIAALLAYLHRLKFELVAVLPSLHADSPVR